MVYYGKVGVCWSVMVYYGGVYYGGSIVWLEYVRVLWCIGGSIVRLECVRVLWCIMVGGWECVRCIPVFI